ncbi:MAG: Holliday junction branch migration protein RuvA [Verrucomicrobia bacterium]|nr:MAG: Holliday junction branch migration protein RuvA [Verrucomicrobiota bacterium]
MIVSIEGILISATPLQAIVEVGGIGYEVNIPVTTAEHLPGTSQTVKLHTHAVYRDDAQTLYGFTAIEERDFFRLMIEKVSGVGPKVALSIMSKLALPVLRSAIVNGDVSLLAKSPGIGKKTAERLVVELRDKLGPAGMTTGGSVPGGSSAGLASADSPAGRQRDAVLALTALGYKVADADKAVRQAMQELGSDATTEVLIKTALG